MALSELIPWNRNRAMTTGRESDPFLAFRREMDRLFDDVVRGFNAPGPVATTAWPSLDVSETDREYKVKAELPGLDEKDVELTLRDNVLTLSGEKRHETEDKGENHFYSERVYGRFQRSIPFPTEVDADKVQASFKNGVLSVTLPKSPTAQEKAKRIQINTA